MKQEATNFSLKDNLFNSTKVLYLSGLIKDVYVDFNRDKFCEEVVIKFPKLELKERIFHIRDILHKYLPRDFKVAVKILIKSLPVNSEDGTLDNNFGDFIFSPYGEFVSFYGLKYIDTYLHGPLEYKSGLDFCLESLETLTTNFSCEFPIRDFYNTYPEETFTKTLEWSKSENYHVRRLSSEGTRTKLPWGKGISLDYRRTIQILDILYQDESRYVTRSVANHLNDISKIDAQLVVDTLKNWKKAKNSQDIDYIISHSTRGLVKQGHKETLALLGYSHNPKVNFSNFEVKRPVVTIGGFLEFSFDLDSTSKQNLIIDYKIYFLNKTGVLKPKVFKIKKMELDGNKNISKKHPLRMMTTKALYEGEHQVEIIINGKSFGKKDFELLV